MSAIKVSDETYGKLLELKNHITVKIHYITNKEIIEKTKQGVSLDQLDPKKTDYEPEYSFDQFLSEIVTMIWWEQQEGEVAFIT